jgi:hypothetical protein
LTIQEVGTAALRLIKPGTGGPADGGHFTGINCSPAGFRHRASVAALRGEDLVGIHVERRATIENRPACTNVAATISRFKASGYDGCRRRRLFVSITEFVGTSSHHASINIEASVIPPAPEGRPTRERYGVQARRYGAEKLAQAPWSALRPRSYARTWRNKNELVAPDLPAVLISSNYNSRTRVRDFSIGASLRKR